MVDRYDKADILAVIGIGLAALDMSNIAPISFDLVGEGGIGLAAVAIFGKLYVKHKTVIVAKVDAIRHKVFGSEHQEGDEETIEDVLDTVVDVAEDLADDGVINNSND